MHTACQCSFRPATEKDPHVTKHAPRKESARAASGEMIRIPDSPSCETPSSSSFVGFRLYAFVLGGWAKGYSVPLVDQSGNDRSEFGLIATVYYTDGTNQAFTAHFNPCVDIWQFTSTAIVARSAYSSIKVSMAYDYNC